MASPIVRAVDSTVASVVRASTSSWMLSPAQGLRAYHASSATAEDASTSSTTESAGASTQHNKPSSSASSQIAPGFVVDKIQLNRSMRFEESGRASELGIVRDMQRRQDLDFQLLLARHRVDMRQALEKAPLTGTLEQALHIRAAKWQQK